MNYGEKLFARGAHGYVGKSRPITDLIDEVERLLI
jgi:hypothetical protein